MKLYKTKYLKILKMDLFIDEAGRGPVIGPMVIAGVIIDKKIEGVKDSKQLTKKQREELFKKIIENCIEYNYVILDAKEIDELRKIMSLNEIEAYAIAKLIKKFKNKYNRVFVDSPDVIAERFGNRINNYLGQKIEIIAEHKADIKYYGVSCASIIAKVIRDKEIEKIEKENNIIIGTGYPHDEQTINVVKKYIKKGEKPDFIRYSWETTKRIINEKNKINQKTLLDFQ